MQFSLYYFWTPIAMFLIGYLLIRIAGKKSVTQMSSFDLIIIMIVGTTISEPIVSKNNWIATWFSLVVVLCYIVISRLALVNKFKALLTASPTILIRKGDIDKAGLKKAKINVEMLLGILRVKGYTSVKDVEMATLEENGQISVIPKSDKRPLQPTDIQLSPSPAFVSIPLIVDGEIVYHNLKFINKSMSWLLSQMQAHELGENNLHEVTLATYNQQGFVEFDTSHVKGQHAGSPSDYMPGNEN